MTHRFSTHVYYEDTDMAGIVYYANYLKYIERARTEFVRHLGVDQSRLKDEDGLVFAVRRVEADYLAPARFDDALVVETAVERVSGARIVMQQTVQRNGTVLFKATVTIVAVTTAGLPARLPASLRQQMH